MMLRLFLICLTIVFFSCNQHQQAQKAGPKPVPSEETIVQKTASDINSRDLVRFERTVCYGKCPVYQIAVKEDLSVIYNGLQNVERKGQYRSKISVAKLELIYSKASSINYFSLDKRYPGPEKEIQDVPSVITYIKSGDKRHSINNQHQDDPEELAEFEQWLDEFFLSLDWKAID